MMMACFAPYEPKVYFTVVQECDQIISRIQNENLSQRTALDEMNSICREKDLLVKAIPFMNFRIHRADPSKLSALENLENELARPGTKVYYTSTMCALFYSIVLSQLPSVRVHQILAQLKTQITELDQERICAIIREKQYVNMLTLPKGK
jgi:hypothetical protein